eukprot:6832300-Lingulodinium_polyedra.AAC.1
MLPRARRYPEGLIVNGQCPRIWAALGGCPTAAMLCRVPARQQFYQACARNVPTACALSRDGCGAG